MDEGDHIRLVAELEVAVEEEPLRERRWAQLVLALYRSGRQAEALRALARLRSGLAEELGVNLSPALVALEQSVLLHSPELDYHGPTEAGPSKALESARPRRSALPAWLTSFVGRADDLSRVEKLISERRLVTLAGSGGCGKTRLAVEVAARVEGSFSGGVYFAALAPVTDPGLVATAVADALMVQPQSERRLADVIAEVVGHRETLVVIDNCEHVVGGVAELVEELLRTAPGLQVLATTREPLKVDGETVWRVPSLAVARPGAGPIELRGNAAVELFVDRALSAKPDLKLDVAALATTGEITRRLDGMPLAIELAAARVGVLDLESILDGLNDSFSILAGGSRTAPPRHQTLRAAVAWSYDLLSQSEKALFCRLCVFPGSFGLEAAVAVAGAEEPEAAEDLFALVSKSMVTIFSPDGAPTRYGLLETLRQFGAAQIDEETKEQARAQHARFFLGLVHALGPEPRGPQLGAWMRWLDLEFINVRSALSYIESSPDRVADFFSALVTMRRFWIYSYLNRRVGLHLVQRALAHPAVTDDPRLAAWLFATASSLAFNFDLKLSARYAEASSDLALRSGDATTVALTSSLVAQVRSSTGEGNEAEAAHALRLARDVGDPLRVYEALLGVLGTPASGLHTPARWRVQDGPWWSSENLARTRYILEEILAIGKEMGDPNICLLAHMNLLSISYVKRDREEQRSHLQRYLAFVEEVGLEPPMKYVRLAQMSLADEDAAAALEALEHGLDLARRGDQPVRIGEVSVLAASSAVMLGSDEIAASLYGFAQHELETAGFVDALQEVYEFERDSKVLGSRLGASLAAILAKGATMTREEVAQLVSHLRHQARR
jgi:predicted ATPase